MFVNDVTKKEEVQNAAVQSLRDLGVKFRPKKLRNHESRTGGKVFRIPLGALPVQTVTMATGQQLRVPKVVDQMCSFVLAKVETEGLFRKAGSKARQNEMQMSLDTKGYLKGDCHVIDVANLLKAFFRDLPEPLLPYSYHEVFLRSMLLTNGSKIEGLFLLCLLLPAEHLNTLAYFMQFLQLVSKSSAENKMSATNLAIVFGPTLLPTKDKVTPTAHRLEKTYELLTILIENSGRIGMLPESLLSSMASTSVTPPSGLSEENLSAKRKKKRRSGSLTRMFSGIKKMVASNKTVEENEQPQIISAPDMLLTPCITRSAKKRKLDGISNKKRKEVIGQLPENCILSTPYNSIATNQNPKPKLRQWNLGSKRKKRRASTGSEVSAAAGKSKLERGWNAMSQAAAAGLKRTRTYAALPRTSHPPPIPVDDKITAEYEEIKSRVSEIERRISLELDLRSPDGPEKVQTAYEKTLVNAEPLSPTTDQLAKRFSKELKIRRSADQKVVRSPSARKIGSIRRSRELEQHHTKNLHRTKSWHQPQTAAAQSPLRRARGASYAPPRNSDTPLKPRAAPESPGASWTSAEGFFRDMRTPNSSFEGGLDAKRASIARLRSQNAGMVLAKAKLFDGMVDGNGAVPKLRVGRVSKIGARRVVERSLGGVRASVVGAGDESGGGGGARKRVSPRRRIARSPTTTKVAAADAEKENNKDADAPNPSSEWEKAVLRDVNCDAKPKASAGGGTPRRMPAIRKPLTVAATTKTPKRQCHTPMRIDRQTPMKCVI